MTKRLKLLAIVPTPESNNATCTAYFYNKREQMLLPLELPSRIIHPLISSTAHIHNTFKRAITALEGKIISIKIYLFKKGTFYTYIRIRKQKKVYDINLNLEDAICIAALGNCPIFIKSDILQKRGLLVTRKMVEEALIQNQY